MPVLQVENRKVPINACASGSGRFGLPLPQSFLRDARKKPVYPADAFELSISSAGSARIDHVCISGDTGGLRPGPCLAAGQVDISVKPDDVRSK